MTTHTESTEVNISADEWWFVFDPASKTLVVPPRQCAGRTFTPFILCVADTYEACAEYIAQHGISTPPDSSLGEGYGNLQDLQN
jgi:hypothetical protein